MGVASDRHGNLFVADTGHHVIRKITPDGVMGVFAGAVGRPGHADGIGPAARFNSPAGIAIDATGRIYVADSGNHLIREISAQGQVRTLAGLAGVTGSADGFGAAAKFYYPQSIAVNDDGIVYVADSANHTIRRITSSGQVSTLAGSAGNIGALDGRGAAARFYYPTALALDRKGKLYVADTFNSTLRKVSPDGEVTTIAGKAGSAGFADGQGRGARFRHPSGLTIGPTGDLVVADTGNGAIRRVTAEGMVATLASAQGHSFHPGALTLGDEDTLYVLDAQAGNLQAGGYSDAPVSAQVVLGNAPLQHRTVSPPLPDAHVTPIPGATVYGTAPDGATLEWVEYPPTNGAPSPWPVVLIIHGGGFRKGDPFTSDQSVAAAHDFANAGYLALSITYRLAPPGRILQQTSSGYAPEQYDDCKMAVRAARADPRCNGQVAVLGGAAGGTHGEWLALDHITTIDPPWSASDRPDAVVALSPPSDFTDYRPDPNLTVFVDDVTNYCNVPDVLDPTPEDRAILESHSPAFQVDAEVRPILLVFSEQDVTPAYQFGDMVAALDAAFGSLPKNYEALSLPGGAHSFELWSNLVSDTETVRDRALTFIALALGNPTPTPTPPGAPTITKQPPNITVAEGHRASFDVIATGAPPLSYQWRKNGVEIRRATKSTYDTPPATIADNGALFSVVVTNSYGSVQSADAVLTVRPNGDAPVITRQPAGAKVHPGQMAKFSIVATGAPPLAYQWYKNDLDIPGATSPTYITPPAIPADNGAQFSVVVSNSFGSATSKKVILAVR